MHEILSLCVPTTPPLGGELRKYGGGDVTIYGINGSSSCDVTVYGINDYSNSDVMICRVDVYANYDTYVDGENLPMTPCDNSKVVGTINHDDVTVLYAIYKIYGDDFPMTTCGNSKADDTISARDVTGLLTS